MSLRTNLDPMTASLCAVEHKLDVTSLEPLSRQSAFKKFASFSAFSIAAAVFSISSFGRTQMASFDLQACPRAMSSGEVFKTQAL